MSEQLFDPSIHLKNAPLDGYFFDSKALLARMEELKKAPTAEMKEWLSAHPEHKGFTRAALAEYAGISEAALKKLKSGQIADPRGSTFWILFRKFGIRPREVLSGIPEQMCNIECVNQARMKLKDATERIAELDQRHAADQAELSRLRKEILRLSTELSECSATLAARDKTVSNLEGMRKKQTKTCSQLIAAACALGVVALGASMLVFMI